MAERRFRIVICRGPECGNHRGSAVLQEAFSRALEQHGCRARAELTWQSCFGRCTQGPNVLVREILTTDPLPNAGFAALPGPRGTTALYNQIDPARCDRIVTQHVRDGQIIREYIERPGILASVPVASTTSEKDPSK